MFFKLKNNLNRKIFDTAIKGILNTPPIAIRPANLTILSMICQKDLLMYLLAIKSFYSQLKFGNIVIIDDGSLDDKDKEILNFHLENPKIIQRNEISIGNFLQHIMWERLACALDMSEGSYLIQLDADTLTTGPLDEVRACIDENRGFIMGEGLPICSVQEAHDYASKFDSTHIQTVTEKALIRLPNADSLKYVRGSAGLFGFPRNGCDRNFAEDFYIKMSKMFPDRFHEWGTDQICCNFIIANLSNACLLPFPQYACFQPDADVDTATFLHFIGTHRFYNRTFIRKGQEFISHAKAAARALDGSSHLLT